MTSKKRGPASATEFMAELAADPEYQRKKDEFEAAQRARTEPLRAAEQPIVRDLSAVGVEVSSVWDLVNTSDPYPDALPVLFQHLQQGGYPDRVMESLGRALAVKPSVAWWEQLKALYLAARGPGEEDGTAVALAACATKDQLGDLIQFLSLESRGESRTYFLRPINRLGGEDGRRVLESLIDDPTFDKEAAAILKRPDKR